MKTILIGIILILTTSKAVSETIILKDGSKFETDSYWEEDGKVYFTRYGQPIGVPKTDILRIEGEENTRAEGNLSFESRFREDNSITRESLDSEYQALSREMADLYRKRGETDLESWGNEAESLRNRANLFAKKTEYYYQNHSRE